MANHIVEAQILSVSGKSSGGGGGGNYGDDDDDGCTLMRCSALLTTCDSK